jgi:D-alanyl-D-alanine carboxypeptidase (penicillin-binding protein 5/6)
MLRNYAGATGVKNGYTVAARGSFVGSATRNGHSYIAVVMRAEGSTWHETTALLDWAFANAGQAKPVGTLIRPGELTSMIGPGLADGSVSAATSTPTPASGEGDGGTLRGALPTQNSLSQPASSGRAGRLLLIGAAMALVLIALVAGRSGRSGWRSDSGRRSRHRG